MPRFSNVGGVLGFGPVDTHDDYRQFDWVWEARVWALSQLMRAKGLNTTDENRDLIERLGANDHLNKTYYERWLIVLETFLAEAGLLDRDALDERAARAERESGKEHFHWENEESHGSEWERRYE